MKIEVQSLAAADEHPLLASFASIRDREQRGSDGHSFIAEGEVVLRVLLSQQRYAVRALLLAEQHWERLHAELPAEVTNEVPVFVAPLSVMQEIVGFSIHRGILALGARGNEVSANDVLTTDGTQVVLGLCGITNHDNVGGLFRNAAAFGAKAVLLDRATCDPLYRKALRVSVGGCLVVPHAYVTEEDALVDQLIERGYTLLALSPRGDLVIGSDARPAATKVALLLGSEGSGLSSRTLARCRTARIPMAAGWDSLNVAVTSGIALAWLRGGRDIHSGCE